MYGFSHRMTLISEKGRRHRLGRDTSVLTFGVVNKFPYIFLELSYSYSLFVLLLITDLGDDIIIAPGHKAYSAPN